MIDDSDCPICGRSYPTVSLERHVNSCLDSQESPLHETQIPDEIEEEPLKRDAFSALGLRLDRKKKVEVKVVKNRPSLTSILIEERRLKRRNDSIERRSKMTKESDRSGIDLERTSDPDISVELGSAVGGNSVVKIENRESFDATISARSDQEDLQANTPSEPKEPEIQEAPDKEESITIESSATADYSKNSPTSPSNIVSKNTTVLPTNTSSKDPPPTSTTTNLPSIAQLQRESSLPLAQRLRPQKLSDFYGQEKLLGPHGLLRNIINSNQIPSFLLWGPPGVGKTSIARIIARTSDYKFVELSGAESNTKRLKEEFDRAENEKHLTGRQTILFLDEIHRFNRAVQDLLLPVIERGIVTVIGATTENPSFTLNNALLSRVHTFVMEPLGKDSLIKVLGRGLLQINTMRKYLYKLHFISFRRDALEHLAELAMGDSRVALNLLESVNAYFSTPEYSSKERLGVINLNAAQLKPVLSSRNFQQLYDRHGDGHYDNISAFHKSIRGNDGDAAIFYLTKMLVGGEDPLFIMRRMIVMASEDIGLRDSSCLPFTTAAKEALEFVGMPEGEIILAHTALKLARAPKSKKSYRALRAAQSFLKENPQAMQLPVPIHLRNAPTGFMKDLGYGQEYRHNPDYVHGRVSQTYLPPELEGKKFVGELHNGTLEDPKLPKEEYEQAEKEDTAYKEFKETKRRELRKIWASSDRSTNAFELSYDENLPKESQPEYFDGEERDVYSDDPDCVSNFNAPYDEFLDNAELEEETDNDELLEEKETEVIAEGH